jgi:hypothetical protein
MKRIHDLSKKGFHCRNNPEHIAEAHKLIPDHWSCCEEYDLEPYNDSQDGTLIMPPQIL